MQADRTNKGNFNCFEVSPLKQTQTHIPLVRFVVDKIVPMAFKHKHTALTCNTLTTI